MSHFSGGRWYFSIRTTLIATLAGIQLVSLFVALAGLDAFLGRFFGRIATAQASQLGNTIKLDLREQMLGEPGAGLQRVLADLRRVNDLRRVWIIDKTGRVAYATDQSTVGRVLDRQHDRACVVCHTAAGTIDTHTSFETNEASVPVIRYVDVFANEQQCQRCHDAKRRINGIVLVEQSTGAFNETLAAVRRRLAATGGATLVALVGATFLALTVLILGPVRRLMTGVAQVGLGDLTARVPVQGRGELARLAGAFNEMTGDLGRHIEEVRNKTAELSIVYAILGRLTRSIDLAELRDIVLHAFLQVFGADHAVLLSRRDGASSIEGVARTRDEVRARRICFDGHSTGGCPEGFPLDQVDRWRRRELSQGFVTKDLQVAVFPIQTTLKTSLLLMVRRERPFSESETNAKLLSLVAEHVGVAFNNAELYSQAITDELTGLFTSRHFYERLHDCMASHARDGRVFCVIMIDLDHFKLVNDQWGHLAGDAVLKSVATVLRNSIRLPDSVYRYGGDELAVLLPEAEIGAGREVAERVQRAIADLRVTLSSDEIIRVTASIGIASYPVHGTAAPEMVAAADAALYEAKRAGRNRVAEPVLPTVPDSPLP